MSMIIKRSREIKTQMPLVFDTSHNTRQVTFPNWGNFLKIFRHEDQLKDDIKAMRDRSTNEIVQEEVDCKTYANIRKSDGHHIATNPITYTHYDIVK